MRKKTYSFFFIVWLIVFLVVTPFSFIRMVKAVNYVIDGEVVYVDDENCYIAVYPHTVNRSRYVYLNVTSKKYEGEIDFCFGFDKDFIKPKSLDLYKPHNVTTDYSKHLSLFFSDELLYKVEYNYTSRDGKVAYDGFVWCYKNVSVWDYPPEDFDNATVIGWEWNEQYSHSFDVGNFTSQMIYWTEPEFKLWRNIRDRFDFQVVNYEFHGMNKWFLASANVTKNLDYHLRIFVEALPKLGSFQSKYFVAFKPSFETLHEAIENGHLYFLDPWLSGEWDKRVKITIDHNDVDSTLTNFPVLVYLSASDAGRNDEDVSFIFDEVEDEDLKIAFTSSDGETELYAEVEYWDNVTEKAWIWVNVTSISSSVDTDIYMYYDKDHADNTAYIGNDPNDAATANVWDSDFMVVHHLVGSQDTELDDSTTNNNDVTSDGGTPEYNQDGKIGKAVDLERGSSEYLGIPDDATLDGYGTAATFEFWLNAESLPASTGIYHQILCKYLTTGNQRSWQIHFFYTTGANYMRFLFSSDGSSYQNHHILPSLSLATWYYITIVWLDGAVSKMSVDSIGKTVTSDGTTSSIKVGTAPVDVGRSTYSPTARYFDGLFDEVRISDVERNSAWLNATYETERDDLLDFGSEETSGVTKNFYGDVTQQYGVNHESAWTFNRYPSANPQFTINNQKAVSFNRYAQINPLFNVNSLNDWTFNLYPSVTQVFNVESTTIISVFLNLWGSIIQEWSINNARATSFHIYGTVNPLFTIWGRISLVPTVEVTTFGTVAFVIAIIALAIAVTTFTAKKRS